MEYRSLLQPSILNLKRLMIHYKKHKSNIQLSNLNLFLEWAQARINQLNICCCDKIHILTKSQDYIILAIILSQHFRWCVTCVHHFTWITKDKIPYTWLNKKKHQCPMYTFQNTLFSIALISFLFFFFFYLWCTTNIINDIVHQHFLLWQYPFPTI